MVRSSPAARRRTRSRIAEALLAGGVVLVLLTLLAYPSFAAIPGKTITLGADLNDAQRTELLGVFKAKSNDRIITVSANETITAMEGIFPPGTITSAYSSTALTCRKLGDGLDVTTSNITVVTPDLFAIALVTAGIGDATLVVAAPSTAEAGGMTALAGTFKTWDIAPCDSGATSKTRQRLALEEIAVAVEIGQSLTAAGVADGVQRAGNVALEAQKTIVTGKLTKSADIDAAIVAQEKVQGVTVAPDQHAKLLDVMSRLAKEKIDWSTFAAGWSIVRDTSNTRITMTGDGIAIRAARASATAQAAANMTATAQADAALAAKQTATANAQAVNATETAQAESASATAEANARATDRASAAMTATAAAQPSATATPTATATPAPSAASGKIVGLNTNEIVVAPPGGGAGAPLAIAPNAAIIRDGKAATFSQLKVGDSVQVTVDGVSHAVTDLRADPAPVSLLKRFGAVQFGGFFLFGGVLSTFIFVWHRNRNDPFVVTLRRP
jgi:uncharacterized protein YpuA (DUF1002 family)